MTKAEMKAIAFYIGEDRNAIVKTALDMCPPTPTFNTIRQLALIVAMMIEKSHWGHAGVGFGTETGTGRLFFRAGNDYICISGYNLAYQVKLCTDLLEKQGYFA